MTRQESAGIAALAMSKAGHDKGCLFAVVREEGEFVFLADGKGRTLKRPKKKNKKHIQIITHFSADLSEQQRKRCTDSDIVCILRRYAKSRAGETGCDHGAFRPEESQKGRG